MFWRKTNQHLRFFREKISQFRRESVWKRFLGEQILQKKGNSNHSLSLGEKASNFSLKVPSKAVRTAFYVSKGWILGKKLEVYSSLIFSDTAQIFLDFMRKVFCRIINYAFYSPKGSFWEKFLFEICASHSRISSYNRWEPVAQNCLVGLWIQSVQIILFLKKKSCWKIYQFFLDCEQ